VLHERSDSQARPQHAEKNKSPSSTIPKYSIGWFLEWARLHFGLMGIIGLLLVIALIFAWWNFDKLKELPISSKIIHRLSEAPLPRASGKSFAVGFVHWTMTGTTNMRSS
jgi:hypothetical protein